jgi:hypothetical protein
VAAGALVQDEAGAASSSGVQPGAVLAAAGESEQQPSSSGRGGGGFGGAPFASLSFSSMGVSSGLGKASRAVLGTLARAARHAPARRQLTRPQRRPAASSGGGSRPQQRSQQ